MDYSNDGEWLFIRRISDKVVAHDLKAKGPGREIQPFMALIRESHALRDGFHYFFAHTPGRTYAVLCYKLPYFCDVLPASGWKTKRGSRFTSGIAA
jgi:hypothetical protein